MLRERLATEEELGVRLVEHFEAAERADDGVRRSGVAEICARQRREPSDPADESIECFGVIESGPEVGPRYA